MSEKVHNMISFDSDSWEDIRKMLELGENLKCKYCNVNISKDNIGGISFPKRVFCRNTVCLIQHVMEQNEKHDTPQEKDDE